MKFEVFEIKLHSELQGAILMETIISIAYSTKANLGRIETCLQRERERAFQQITGRLNGLQQSCSV